MTNAQRAKLNVSIGAEVRKLDSIEAHPKQGLKNEAQQRRMDELATRIDRLEVAPAKTSTEKVARGERRGHGESASVEWQPSHIILGGWPPNMGQDVIENESNTWLACMPQSMHEACIMPCAPKKYRKIAKLRIQAGASPECENDEAMQVGQLGTRRQGPGEKALQRTGSGYKRVALESGAAEHSAPLGSIRPYRVAAQGSRSR